MLGGGGDKAWSLKASPALWFQAVAGLTSLGLLYRNTTIGPVSCLKSRLEDAGRDAYKSLGHSMCSISGNATCPVLCLIVWLKQSFPRVR